MPRIEAWEPFEAGASTTKLVRTLSGDPHEWLPQPATDRGPGHWAVEVRAGPASRLATCMVGEPHGDEHSVRRHIRWRADPEPEDEHMQRALPSFDGYLTLRSRDGDWPELRLEGDYAAPTGSIGAALGPSQQHALAAAAARGFLHDVFAKLIGDDRA
ncbi:MAG: hypothetical protein KY462_04640 [Actinobacteria bacterium]|nr:hypothetical protein [Actinomycetota bacterium]